jgi:hypothetical protein
MISPGSVGLIFGFVDAHGNEIQSRPVFEHLSPRANGELLAPRGDGPVHWTQSGKPARCLGRYRSAPAAPVKSASATGSRTG